MINLSALAVRERAVTLFAIIVISLAGILAFNRIGRAEDPNLTIKTMVVTAVWPGATPQEMTTQVSDKLEKRIQELRWFDHVQTYNRPGFSILEITLKDATPPAEVAEQWYQVRKKLGDERANLPAGVVSVGFNDEFSDVDFALFALQAPGLPERELVQRAETLRERYLQVPGVQKVDLIGEQKQRFFVEFSYRRLATLGIPADALFTALSKANIITPGGSIESNADKVYVRLDAALNTEAGIAATPIVANGRTLTVGDIATVKRGYENPPSYLVSYNGRPALMLGVVMRRDYNGTTLGDALHAKTDEIRSELPLGITINQTADQAKVIEHATGEFMLKFVVALVTVMIVSFIALGLRTGLIVAAAVPLTLGITFVLMMLTGKNFDRITTGALILSLGLLVDDAIISIEMMIVKMEGGMGRVKAASFAWTSTAAPMLTGTLVTIIGFLPVGFAASSSGEYAANIFWITAFALIASWFVAVMVTPYLGVAMLPKIAVVEGGHDAIYGTPRYKRLRGWITYAVDNRKLVLVATLAAFIVAVLAMTFVVRKQFFPSSDRVETLVEVYLPEGSAVGTTAAAVKRVEAIVAKAPETLYYTSFVGAGPPRFFLSANPELPSPAFGKVVVQTRSDTARNALKARVDAAVRDGAVPGARVRATELLLGPPIPFPVSFRVRGPDPGTVRQIARRVLAATRGVGQVRNMNLEWSDQALTAHLQIDRARLAQLGLSEQDVSRQLSTLFDGALVTQARDGNRTVDVIARSTDAERRDLGSLDSVTITNASGQSIPLAQVAHIKPGYEEPLLKRYNRLYAMNVRGDPVEGVQPDQASAAIDAKLGAIRASLPARYSIEIGGTPEENAKANVAIGALGPLTLILMLTLIMIQVRSFPAMFMTILTAPLGLIGAVVGLLVFNAPFGFTAILGLLGLFGILMRNTLILIEQIHENEAEGRPAYEALIEATVHRTRPVVLTAIAGMLAFSPLTLTALWGPMAITLIGGFGVGTVLTLLVLPALYAFWFKIRKPAAA